MSETLLEVKDLKKHYPVRKGVLQRIVAKVHAVDGVSFYLKQKETLGIVGESGCGKTTLLMMIQRLIEPTSGSVSFNGQNIFKLSRNELKNLRRNMAMIFQDPYSSLDPRMTVADIIGEPLEVQGIAKGAKKLEIVKEWLDRVRLPSYYIYRYPHQLSGGEKQRVGIARALVAGARLLFADEPVSSLDVSVRAKILNLIMRLQKTLGLTSLYVSHDLRTVKYLCDRVAVMYLGKFVELASSETLYENPLHPYTQALMYAIPRLDRTIKKDRIILKGEVPTPVNPPSGCRFHPRCIHIGSKCTKEEPPFIEIEKGHFIACHLYE